MLAAAKRLMLIRYHTIPRKYDECQRMMKAFLMKVQKDNLFRFHKVILNVILFYEAEYWTLTKKKQKY
jgi:hypothetical protein